MDARRKAILQHPTQEWLQVVVWEGSLAELLRRLGYADVIELADEPLDERGKEDDGNSQDGSFYHRTTDG